MRKLPYLNKVIWLCFFGGSWCDLSYHIDQPDPCIDSVINKLAPKHKFGTEHDQLALAGIIIGSIILLLISFQIIVVFFKRKQEVDLEAAPLLARAPKNIKQLEKLMPLFFKGRFQTKSLLCNLPKEILFDIATNVAMGNEKCDPYQSKLCQEKAIGKYKSAVANHRSINQR